MFLMQRTPVHKKCTGLVLHSPQAEASATIVDISRISAGRWTRLEFCNDRRGSDCVGFPKPQNGSVQVVQTIR